MIGDQCPRHVARLVVSNKTTDGTRMPCSNLFGQSLMVCGFEWQGADIHIRIAALNRDTALGIAVTSSVDQIRPG